MNPIPPPESPKPNNSNSSNQLALFLLIAAIVGVVIYFLNIADKTPTGQSQESAISVDTMSAETETAAAAPAENWYYDVSEDKMGSKIKIASNTSSDRLDFDFPYNGGSTATFTIRRRRGETNLYLTVSKGQFNTSYDGGVCRFRFDSNPPVVYRFAGPSDGSSDIIFFTSVSAILKKIKKAKRMIIEAEFYNEGNRQIEFDVSNLKWK